MISAMSDSTEQNRVIPVILADRLIVEAVGYGSGTLCLSTQAGCAVGCPFCASGRRGLRRNLSLDELHAQIAAATAAGLLFNRLTLSGIGEPLHNWPTIRQFIDSTPLPVSVTTTAARLDLFAELLTLPHNGVMLSLHGATAATHRALIPHGPDFTALGRLLDTALPSLSRRQRRRIGVNYLLLAGHNDNPKDFAALCDFMRLYPDLTLHLLQSTADDPRWQTDPAVLQRWHTELIAAGINTRRPNRWRTRRDGGCGTLYLRHLNESETDESHA